VAVFAALLGFAMFASPVHGALAAQSTEERDVDDPGRIPHQTIENIGEDQEVFSFPAVAPGHRLVIQHVSGNLNFGSAVNNQVEVFVRASGGGSSRFFAQFSASLVRFDEPVQLYVDAGDSPKVVVMADSGTTAVSDGVMSLSGYLLDCTAAPCAKIAH
jgi:hypothetical protein